MLEKLDIHIQKTKTKKQTHPPTHNFDLYFTLYTKIIDLNSIPKNVILLEKNMRKIFVTSNKAKISTHKKMNRKRKKTDKVEFIKNLKILHFKRHC